MKAPASDLYPRIYAVVRRVPAGKVVTYGQVAALAGIPRHARLVGYAMHALPEGSDVPWQRVINAKGEISARQGEGWEEGYQRHLLEEEGVVFDEAGRVSLKRFRWEPSPRRDRKGSLPGQAQGDVERVRRRR